MLKHQGHKIEMIEGDFGIGLPIEIITGEGETIGENDNFRVSVFKEMDSEPLIEKIYQVDENNTFDFILTEQESKLLEVGYYLYDIDYYSGNIFMNNLIAKEDFNVKEKARALNED